MAPIPSGTVPHGAASWLQASLTPGERKFVLSTSAPGRPSTMTVRSKVLKRTPARPYDVVQVTIAVSRQLDAGEQGWVVDNSSTTYSLPIATVAGKSFGSRLKQLILDTCSYAVGGFEDGATALADITSALGDTVADQLTMGLI